MKLLASSLLILLLFSHNPAAIAASGYSPLRDYNTAGDILLHSEKQSKSDSYYLLALQEIKKNNPLRAFNSINAGLRENKYDIRLLRLRGFLFARSGKLKEAYADFSRILLLSPEDEYSTFALREVKTAIDNAQSSIELLYTPPEEQKNRKVKDKAPKVDETSEKTPEKILTSSYFDNMRDKQQCLHNMDTLQRAYENYKKTNSNKPFSIKDMMLSSALKFEPLCPNRGNYTWTKNQIECSVHGKEKPLRGEVTTIFGDFNKALQQKQRKNYLEAEKLFKQALIFYPRWPELYYQLGDTYFKMGRLQEAITHLEKALSMAPDNLDIQMLLAHAHFKQGSRAAALAHLDKIIKENKSVIHSMSAKSIARKIREGKSYEAVFPTY